MHVYQLIFVTFFVQCVWVVVKSESTNATFTPAKQIIDQETTPKIELEKPILKADKVTIKAGTNEKLIEVEPATSTSKSEIETSIKNTRSAPAYGLPVTSYNALPPIPAYNAPLPEPAPYNAPLPAYKAPPPPAYGLPPPALYAHGSAPSYHPILVHQYAAPKPSYSPPAYAPSPSPYPNLISYTAPCSCSFSLPSYPAPLAPASYKPPSYREFDQEQQFRRMASDDQLEEQISQEARSSYAAQPPPVPYLPPAAAYLAPPPPSQVQCPSNLLVGCGPSLATVPCSAAPPIPARY